MDQKKRFVFLIVIFLFTTTLCFSKAEAVSLSARNAILIEQESGRILFEKDAYTPQRIASITKIMTAIIAIESGKLDEKVKITSDAVHVEGSSIYLKEGDVLPLRDLVYGLMLRSGNDAAIAIADYVGGSVDGFVYMMNQKAEEIGMEHTVFSNPHGLDDSEEHYSTAYDMALLTRYAMNNETFKEIFATKTYRPSHSDGVVWKNKNKLLTGLYKYSTGGKTGYTKKARRTLVSTAAKNGMDLIAVTLHAPDDWNDHIAMFENAFASYEMKKLVGKGKYRHIKNDFYRGKLVIKQPVYYPLANDEEDDLSSSLVLYRPPKHDEWEKEGIPTPVGKLRIFLNGDPIQDIPLFFEGNPVNDGEDERFLNKIRDLFFAINGIDPDD